MRLDLNELIQRHTTLSEDLAQLLRELGDTRSMIAKNQSHVWHATTHLGITERRDEVRHSAVALVADTEQQLGEIEALRAEIANVELLFRYAAAAAEMDA